MRFLCEKWLQDTRTVLRTAVVGYDGRLNIRPAFQREFIYKDKQRDEVIRTITKNFPLNVMYWVKNDDGNFEVLDGQAENNKHLPICFKVTSLSTILHLPI